MENFKIEIKSKPDFKGIHIHFDDETGVIEEILCDPTEWEIEIPEGHGTLHIYKK